MEKRPSNRALLLVSALLTLLGIVLLVLITFAGATPNFLSTWCIVTVQSPGQMDNAYVLTHCNGTSEINTCSSIRVSHFDAKVGSALVHKRMGELRSRFLGMAVCYFLGLVLAALTFIMCLIGTIFAKSRSAGGATMFIVGFTFALVCGGSGIATSLSGEIVKVITEDLSPGLTAVGGKRFLRISWATTALFFVVLFIWIGDYLKRKYDSGYRSRKSRSRR